jgi:hypothetical protein
LCLSSPLQASNSQSLAEIALSLKTPQQVAHWLAQEFHYRQEYPFLKHSTQEFLNLKKGSCADFALLSREIFKSQGIPSTILIIKFKGLKQMHAICIFKAAGGYQFISNRDLVDTTQPHLISAIEKKFPDWEKIIFSNQNLQYLRTISKNSCPQDWEKIDRLAASLSY